MLGWGDRSCAVAKRQSPARHSHGRLRVSALPESLHDEDDQTSGALPASAVTRRGRAIGVRSLSGGKTACSLHIIENVRPYRCKERWYGYCSYHSWSLLVRLRSRVGTCLCF